MIYVFPSGDINSTNLSCFCYALLSVLSSFAIDLTKKRKLVTLLQLSSCCLVTVSVMWLYLALPGVCLQCVSVVFPDHTHLLSGSHKYNDLIYILMEH